MAVSDSELLYMIHQRNEFAFKELFNKYISISKTWIFKRYANYSFYKSIKDDLLSIAMYSVNEAIYKYVPTMGPFYPFCKIVVINKTYTEFLTYSKQKQILSLEQGLLYEDELLFNQMEDESKLLQPLEYAKNEQMLNEYLYNTATKSKDEMNVSKLRLEGYTVEEIAKILNLSVSIIKYILLKKKSQMQNKFNIE
jgi:DNA-directed RNA polymerase specialized sigma24 family protein